MDNFEHIEKAAQERLSQKETYLDAAGIKHCAKCGQPLERYITLNGKQRRVPAPRCACDDVAETEQIAKEQRTKVSIMAKSSPLHDPNYDRFTFAVDSTPDSEASKLCRAYVEHWDEIEQENIGLLLSGPVGTGKSFYAAAVVNALRERGVSAIIVTTSRLINLIMERKEPQSVVDELNKFHLVVLDDLGAERDTEYAVEQLENFINARDLSGLPLVVTTNLPRQQFDRPENMSYSRIFDRVKKLCQTTVVLTGPSRRGAQGQDKAKRFREIIGM